jgi:hypothetical protein
MANQTRNRVQAIVATNAELINQAEQQSAQLKADIAAILATLEAAGVDISTETTLSLINQYLANLFAGFMFGGIVHPDTAQPASCIGINRMVFIAAEPGLYENFGALQVNDAMAHLYYDRGTWRVQSMTMTTATTEYNGFMSKEHVQQMNSIQAKNTEIEGIIRQLKVQILFIADLNDCETNGMYYVDQIVGNAPDGGNKCYIQVIKAIDNFYIQNCWSTTGGVYTRTCIAGTFSDWMLMSGGGSADIRELRSKVNANTADITDLAKKSVQWDGPAPEQQQE